MAHTRRLDAIEQRVCGALMEKQQTTPDSYPLTVNALLLACNQKSNREPVMSLGEEALRDALERLRKDVLVWRISGARVDRWEHRLQSRWHLDDRALAIMTLLLLRGPQTPGELRTRSERMHRFANPGEVEEVMRSLSEGDNALFEELPRSPGQRENRWRHVMGREDASSEQPTGAPSQSSTGVGDSSADRPEAREDTRSAVAPSGHSDQGRLERLERELQQLRHRVASLESELGVEPPCED